MTALALPTVAGPIPESGVSRPYCYPRDSAARLDGWGYVQAEYFVSGTASLYGPVPPGNAAAARQPDPDPYRGVVREGAAYTTRILVRRPSDRARFSGTVHMEPLHSVSEGSPDWGMAQRWMMRNGDAWVGVTASSGSRIGRGRAAVGGVARLQELDPSRYGPLHLEPGDIEAWPLLAAQPEDALGGEDLGDVLAAARWASPARNYTLALVVEECAKTYSHSIDVMKHVAALAKSARPDNPLLGMDVERVYVGGASASGGYWQSYLQAGHHAHLEDGRPLVDAYLLGVTVPRPELVPPDDAVVVSIASEAEVLVLAGRGQDSPADTDAPRYRHYEIPGAGHAVTASAAGEPGFGWEVIHFGEHGTDPFAAEYPHPDKPLYPLFHALWHNVEQWVRDGVPMPRTPRVTRDAEASDGIARDACGNVLGGVRSPWIELGDARYFARCPHHSNFGYVQPVPQVLRTAPVDRAGKERIVRSHLDRLAAGGWLLPEDARVYLDAVVAG